jgi:hypothetical protein
MVPRGSRAILPTNNYASLPNLVVEDGVATVEFVGDDGRTSTLTFPRFDGELYFALIEEFAKRVGPLGSRRTKVSAEAAFQHVRTFLSRLSTMNPSMTELSQLTVAVLRAEAMAYPTPGDGGRRRFPYQLLRRLSERLPRETSRYLTQATDRRNRQGGLPGYSPAEFRRIMRAARREVRAIEARIDAGREAAEAAPEDSALGRFWRTGDMDPPTTWPADRQSERELAATVTLTGPDLSPLLILLVGLTGLNSETIKELPRRHSYLDDIAVSLTGTKRRRGPALAELDLVWPIGTPTRRLFTKGGAYLLLLRLSEWSAAQCETDHAFTIWSFLKGHYSPYEASLVRRSGLGDFARRNRLEDDDGNPLELTLNRLRTSVEVRRTIRADGDLRTAAQTNSPDVLFASYLRNDPVAKDYAAGVVATAIEKAENAVRSNHGGPTIVTVPDDPSVAVGLGLTSTETDALLAGELDVAFAACTDPAGGPQTDATGTCVASALTCFECRNAVVTRNHLPAIVTLRHELVDARQNLPVREWTDRYGRTLEQVDRNILPAFTPAEVQRAEELRPTSTIFELLHRHEAPYG